ncbi:MAG: carboxy terminal-processing peptidase [Gammaproteobacteria bacterium]|nr:carboxy terminal-processing peptidase [Gammaproteobacteria bacterium]
MKNLLVLACVALLALADAPAFAAAPIIPVKELTPSPEHRRATRLITHFIANYHYRKAALDDEMSRAIFDRYLKSLDPTKSYFLQSDLDSFARHRDRIDDYLRASELQPVYDIFVQYRKRVEERMQKADALLDQNFDFGVDENFAFDREKAPWATSVTELDELWRKRVKNDVLSLRLSGKQPKDIKATLRKRYDGIVRRTEQINAEDVFQMFINAYTTSIDPHTDYFSPRTSENFKIRMSLSLEGIGAVLQNDNEYTLVREIVKGGPADKSGKLHADDRITGIGQGESGDFVDVVGWRLDDVVDLIRGPKNSVVRLQVLPKGAGLDGPSKTVKLIRNTIQLEEQAAQKSVIEVPDASAKMRIGVIELPTFYMDFDARMAGDENYRSTTRDVRKLLKELKKDNVSGIIIDLRGNGGGSLAEATELTGLFVGPGPVVQVKNSQGKVQIERDTEEGVAYDGPLAVLVDGNSASASEIFAGAIQDYKRGVILGEPTFGKGTVQNLVDLNRFDEDSQGKLGQLKATIAQFFRVEGASTQHRGVVPDIAFPSGFSNDHVGERALENALPFAEIPPVQFTPANKVPGNLTRVAKEHSERVQGDSGFQALLAQERALQEARDQKELSLLESKRKQEHDKQRREQRERENQIRVAHGAKPLPEKPAAEEDTAEADDGDDFATRKKDGDKFDVVLEEAGKVLRDVIRVAAPSSLATNAPQH